MPPTDPVGGRGFGQQVYTVSLDDNSETCGGDGRIERTESGEALRSFIKILKKRGQVGIDKALVATILKE